MQTHFRSLWVKNRHQHGRRCGGELRVGLCYKCPVQCWICDVSHNRSTKWTVYHRLYRTVQPGVLYATPEVQGHRPKRSRVEGCNSACGIQQLLQNFKGSKIVNQRLNLKIAGRSFSSWIHQLDGRKVHSRQIRERERYCLPQAANPVSEANLTLFAYRAL